MNFEEEIETISKIDIPQVKNKYEVAEIEFIQQEIQLVTKKIEHEKISLRILQERFEKKKGELNKLKGKPVSLTKDEKIREIKEKMEQMKNRKIFEDFNIKNKKILQPDEENKKLIKDTLKCEIDLGNITKEINKNNLINLELTKKIENMRKEKNRISNQVSLLKIENKKLEEDILIIENKNKEIFSKIKFDELEKVKEEENEMQKNFEEKRDNLENQYHEIIETTIKHEKERKKDLSNKRLDLFKISENVNLKNNNNNKKDINDSFKINYNEDITDRTPILDLLIDKWKYITKYKKQMIEKYIKNSINIRDAFNKMIKFLGIDSFNELPTIYEKMEEQMSSIEIYLSKITNEVDSLKEKENLLNKQIDFLIKNKKIENDEKENFTEKKINHINKLKINNEELIEGINKKRNFFSKLQNQTFKFLNKLQSTYLSEFVNDKMTINENTKINESNIIEFLACVQDYCQLIKDFDKSTQQKNYIQDSYEINKDLDKLKKDINFKLQKFNYENCVQDNVYDSIKKDIKNNQSFDDTIKRLAKEIADQINNKESKINPYNKNLQSTTFAHSTNNILGENGNNIINSTGKSIRNSSSMRKMFLKNINKNFFVFFFFFFFFFCIINIIFFFLNI